MAWCCVGDAAGRAAQRMIYLVWRHNFLQIGRQKNLVYAVSATFLALLYLSLVRRVSGWLEPMLRRKLRPRFCCSCWFRSSSRCSGRWGARFRRQRRGTGRIASRRCGIADDGASRRFVSLLRAIERRVKEQFDLSDAKLAVIEPDLGAEFLPANAAGIGGFTTVR